MHRKLIGSWHSAPVTALQPKLALSPGHPRPEARGLHPARPAAGGAGPRRASLI